MVPSWTDDLSLGLQAQLRKGRGCWTGRYIADLCPPDRAAKGCWSEFYTEDLCCDTAHGRNGLDECWDKDFSFAKCCLRGSPCRRAFRQHLQPFIAASAQVTDEDGRLRVSEPTGGRGACARLGGQVSTGRLLSDRSDPASAAVEVSWCLPTVCLDGPSQSWGFREIFRNATASAGAALWQLWRRSEGPPMSAGAAPASEAIATQFLRVCTRKRAPDESVLRMQRWMGQTGNNVFQVLNAILLAACSQERGVQIMLPPGGPFRELFNTFPSIFQVDAQAWRPSWCGCRQCDGYEPDCIRVWGSFCKATFLERRRLVQTIFLPHLRIESPAIDTFDDRLQDVLTIHIRSGDVKYITPRFVASSDPRSDHMQPPCAYYRSVIDRGRGGRRFSRARIVAEDGNHPCIAEMMARRDLDVQLQSATIAHDVRTLSQAANLAMSRSAFAGLALLFNQNLRRLFQLVGVEHLTAWSHCGTEFEADQYEFWSQSNASELCQALSATAEVRFYRFRFAVEDDDSSYMLNYNVSRMETFSC